MSASRRKLIIVICVALFVLIASICGILLARSTQIRRKMEAIMAEEMRIENAYERLNRAFRLTPSPGDIDRTRGGYIPYRDISLEQNRFGICAIRYMLLRMYYHRTGITLAYETVVEYFSQEFEPDGSLRLYNNGKHPEIEAFVIWIHDVGQDGSQYFRSLDGIYTKYFFAHRDAGFINQSLTALSPQMLDALARAEADPDYVLDLTSLQQQGY